VRKNKLKEVITHLGKRFNSCSRGSDGAVLNATDKRY
jgi:hypothetical protein